MKIKKTHPDIKAAIKKCEFIILESEIDRRSARKFAMSIKSYLEKRKLTYTQATKST